MKPNIYYCWFGRGEKTPHFYQCLATWQKAMPQANIIEINEDNFDIHWCQYSAQAYHLKKYAFVSDVARVYYLYHYGGIYLDTDVLMTRSLQNLLMNDKLQLSLEWYDDELTGINTGTMICQAKDPIIEKLLEMYRQITFEDKGEYTITINQRFNDLLLMNSNIADIMYELPQAIIYPSGYFCRQLDQNNYTIHDYQTTWRQQRQGWLAIRHHLGKLVKRVVGPNLFHYLWRRK